MIDKEELFAILKRRKKSELLAILDRAFDEMEPKTRRAVFLELILALRSDRKDGIRRGNRVCGRNGVLDDPH